MTDLVDIDDAPAPQEIFINGDVLTESDVLSAVDAVLEKLKETNDIRPVDNAIRSLLGIQKFSGLSLAKLLWGWKRWWIENKWDEQSGDTFEDYVFSTHGLKKIHVDRYISVWDAYEKSAMPPQIQSRPMKDQIAIAKAIQQGYEIPKADWKKLQRAGSNNEVLAILRKVKGQPPRKSSLMIYLERDGSLVAWTSDGERHFVGYLNVGERENDPAIDKAINRLTKNSGVIER